MFFFLAYFTLYSKFQKRVASPGLMHGTGCLGLVHWDDPEGGEGREEGGGFTLSAIRVVSSAYLKLLIFLLAILIPACASSSLAFHMMYSAYKLNEQGENIQTCQTFCPVLSQSVVSCSVLTVAS